MSEPIIKVENLSVIYNQGQSNEVRSLDTATTQIFPQEYVIIHGPSGCGKSTLLYAISGLQAPTSGAAFIDGKELAKMNKKEKVNLHRMTIGMVFQAFYLIPSLTIIDNVCLPKVFNGENLKERKEAGMKLLQRFGILEQAHKFPNQLSGGQKQRVAIARSLINNPNIILADEPVGNLDSESAQNVLEILKELNEVDKKTVILVTHSDEHLHYGDRIISMKDGKIIGEEVNREKRPKEVIEKELEGLPDTVSNELKMLARVFKGITAQQAAALLVPYKAKQLMHHVLSDLTDEQVQSGENFLKELMFKNINVPQFAEKLDLDFEDGGAEWNKSRAESFSERIGKIIEASEISGKTGPKSASLLGEYLKKTFHLHLEGTLKVKFETFLRMRLENKIDFFELQRRLDSPKMLGGIGLYKATAAKVAREVEIIMLLKFSSVQPQKNEIH
jgi:putative ABC transport system ATP-binding protein